ncbi:type I-C CRISPR-associated protein Cas7/Csd2 [Sedimentisphaera salicampi]|uniref:CRISPR-associated protein Cas7/Csd2, subtype I-C/DVULG n=1 Tax=Sedimentisphaera salicampi TaxID=1941349 RepID=A0A1W6LLI8_9BACT|nr:type I-C CRISPR-associated protein Cas7/Csd2 [Sedimentisphaera salicampi]ARN56660.1 CRISPR-associated protein Cas7/Csd2, subtype I-C/DVULG [Sedimentisphaera salicampi]
MNEPIKNRYEFVYLFDVENGNPNGDPDAGNMPRIDPETHFGIITDVCLKRKIRNFVEISSGAQPPNDIYVKEKAVLSKQQGKAYQALQFDSKKDKGAEIISQARRWMCQNFYDIRTFGAVMSLKENNCGQVRGPVQINFARSIDPICPLDVTITRMAVATEKEADSQSGDNRTMGRKQIVPYGLYRVEGYISAHLAAQTGFGEEDLEMLWQALINMFDHDHSAARGKMCARKLIVFKHDSALGNAPAHKLFDKVKIKQVGETKPAREFEDYELELPEDGKLPDFQEVTVINKL